MRFNLTIGKYIITFNQACCEFTHFRIYNSACGKHFVWWKFSLTIDNWTLPIHPICKACNSPSIGESSIGDEGWTICNACGGIEQGYIYVNLKEYEKAYSC